MIFLILYFPATFSLDVNCTYFTSNWNDTSYKKKLYSCNVQFLNSSHPDDVIGSAQGEHGSGESDEKVEALIIENSKSTVFPNGFQTFFPNLKTIQMKSSHLAKITPKNLKGFDKLERLDLSNNRMLKIANDSFSEVKTIEILYLQMNRLRDLHEDSFAKLQQLKKLNINDNELTFLPVGIFKNNLKLTRIGLNNNQLIYIPPNTFDHIRSVDMKISLEKNSCIDFELSDPESREILEKHLKECEKNACGTSYGQDNYNSLQKELEILKGDKQKICSNVVFRFFFGYWDF